MRKILIIVGLIVSLGGSGQCWKTVASGRNHTKAIKLDGTLSPVPISNALFRTKY